MRKNSPETFPIGIHTVQSFYHNLVLIHFPLKLGYFGGEAPLLRPHGLEGLHDLFLVLLILHPSLKQRKRLEFI